MSGPLTPEVLAELKECRDLNKLRYHLPALIAAADELGAQKQMTRSVFRSAVDTERELKQTIKDVRSDAEKRIAELEVALRVVAEGAHDSDGQGGCLRRCVACMAEQTLKGGGE